MEQPSASGEALEPTAPARPFPERARAWWHANLEALRIDRERSAYLGVVAFAILFNLAFLFPEVRNRPPDLNDSVFHFLNLEVASDALLHFQDPTDPWLKGIGLGFPIFHYYQHLPYLLPAIVHFATAISLDFLFNLISYLLLSFFPLSIYWSMRKMGFDRPEASFAALVSCLISANGLYGFEFNSYVWAGYGLYTQLWGMVLLPLALAYSYDTARHGRGYFKSVLLLSMVVLSHLAFGYIAFGTLALFVVLSPSRREIEARGKRMLIVLGLVLVVTSYFLLPLLLDSAFLNKSVWDNPTKYDSFGAEKILSWLIHGELFDYDRLPIFTALTFIGLVVCALNWRREERYRLAVAIAVVWLLLYFGRPTWGGLFDVSIGKDFYLHRLIAGVHLGGIMLMGVALAAPWRALARSRLVHEGTRNGVLGVVAIAAVLTAAVLSPAYLERWRYLDRNDLYMSQTNEAFAAEQGDIDTILAAVESLPPGRVFAGLAGQWGRDYRIGSVPMHALLTEKNLDNVGFLWHPWSLNGDVQVLFDESRPELYDLFNIRYIVAPDTRQFPDFVNLVGTAGRHRLYQVDTTGYFEFVNSPIAFNVDKTTFYQAASNWLASGAPSLHLHPALVFPGAGTPKVPNAGAAFGVAQYPPRGAGTGAPLPGRVIEERVDRSEYIALVDAAAESTLMLKVTYHPGWHAYVDGREVDTVMLMPSYIGITVPAGTHGVQFRYQAPISRPFLFMLGAFTLAALPYVERRPERVRNVVSRATQGIRRSLEPVDSEDDER